MCGFFCSPPQRQKNSLIELCNALFYLTGTWMVNCVINLHCVVIVKAVLQLESVLSINGVN